MCFVDRPQRLLKHRRDLGQSNSPMKYVKEKKIIYLNYSETSGLAFKSFSDVDNTARERATNMLECKLPQSAFVDIIHLLKSSWLVNNLSAIVNAPGTNISCVAGRGG